MCSAKFWLIAFDKAIQIINTLGIEGNGYADSCSAIFGGNRVDHLVIRLEKMLEGKMLPYSDNVRYLGVDLDSKLHWKVHINNKIKLAKRALMSIANVTQNSFGPSPKLMRWTYNGIIKPM